VGKQILRPGVAEKSAIAEFSASSFGFIGLPQGA
jgi:hypothetical protein